MVFADISNPNTSIYQLIDWIRPVEEWTRVYNEKEVVSAYISNPNSSISKIIYLIRPVDERSEIAFWAPQNPENEHCETLKKLVQKLKFHQ